MPAAQTASSTPPTRSGPTDPLGGRPPRRLRRRLARLLLLLTALATLSVAASWWLVQREAGRTFDRVADVPERHVGLVLGCSPLLADGRPNLFFNARMDAAAELWHAGKVGYLLVSGDNRHHAYNEPDAMKAALVERAVPARHIVCDYAGLTTLDSVVRAREVFGQDQLIVVSQPFHNRRAIFIGRHRGIDAIGYNAPDIAGRHAVRTHLREIAARQRAVWDCWISRRQPRHLGEPIAIP